MALPTTEINGYIRLPTGANATNTTMQFTLSATDTDAEEDTVITPSTITATLDAASNLSVMLWPNERGIRSTTYRVALVVATADGFGRSRYDLGVITVPIAGPVDIGDLIALEPPECVAPEVWYAQMSAIRAGTTAIAVGAAGEAEASAGQAAAYAATATTKAGEAVVSAGQAAASASVASTKASEAAGSATTANTKAAEASASAATATTKAGEAAASAGTANTKAGEASTSAAAALASRNAAATSATTASTKAGEAATSATTATTKAGEAALSAGSILGLTVAATGLPAGAAPTAAYNAGTGVMALGIPAGVQGVPGGTSYVVSNITQRNLLTPTLGAQALVIDATADPAVTKFSAVYTWLPAISKWVLTQQMDFDVAMIFALGGKGVLFDTPAPVTLTQDAAGTVPVTAAGQPVGRMLDKSGNAAHATQAVASKRPIYGVVPKGGRRNLLAKTHDFALWGKLGLVGLAANGTLGGEPAFLLTDDDPAGYLGITEAVVPIAQATGLYTLTFGLKKETSATSAAGIRLVIRPEATGPVTGYAGCSINPITGGVVAVAGWDYGGRTTTVTDSGGHWHVAMTFTLPAGQAVTNTQIYPAYYSIDGLSGAPTLQGSNTWAAPQLVFGAESPYQRVVSDYNITESGVPSLPYLASDLIDDELPATVPSLGSNATVWFAVDGASTILTGQTVAAGTIATLRGARTYTMGAIDRPLTAGETAALTAYLDKARGAL